MKKLFAMLLALAMMLPVCALADAVLLLNLPEEAQMVESVAFDDGEFIQTYQLPDGVSVQLLRYVDFPMSLEELIAGDWPVNCRVEYVDDLTEISGYPARYAHIWQVLDQSGYPIGSEGSQLKDGQQMLEIDLIVVTVGNETLIYQDSYLSGQRGDTVLPIIDSLQVQMDGVAAGEGEVG